MRRGINPNPLNFIGNVNRNIFFQLGTKEKKKEPLSNESKSPKTIRGINRGT